MVYEESNLGATCPDSIFSLNDIRPALALPHPFLRNKRKAACILMLGQWVEDDSNSAPSSERCGTQGTVSYSAPSYRSMHL